MKEKLKAIGGAVVRHFVGGAGIAQFTGHGVNIGDEDINKLIGALMALGAVCWSIWRKASAAEQPPTIPQ